MHQKPNPINQEPASQNGRHQAGTLSTRYAGDCDFKLEEPEERGGMDRATDRSPSIKEKFADCGD
jgi:hypothetical protein